MKREVKTAKALASRFVDVNGSTMHYLEAGEGIPILFLHGVPASSYVWRNIIPYLAPLGRCIAPDLIGFGKSGKPDIDYSINDHIFYLDAFIKALKLKNLVVVMHGLGSVLGLHYAMQHEANCRGLVLYEAFLRLADQADISLPFQEQLSTFSDQSSAVDLSMDSSLFIDKIIAQTMMRRLNEEEMKTYREPFQERRHYRPILQYLKEMPMQGRHSEIDNIISTYSKKLIKSSLPKLMLYSVPGFITTIATAIWAKANLPNLEVVEIGEELHFGQEAYPERMGETISAWLQANLHDEGVGG